MATGDQRVNIYNKRMVPQEGWEQHFFTYLNNKVIDTARAAFLQPGVLDDDSIGITSSVNDTISLDITNAERGIDGSGNIIDLSQLATSLYEDYPFENTNTTVYYVGFRYQSVPQNVERNPRSSEPEYPWYLDTIGELGDPDSVVDNTTYIRLQLNSILESSVDHSGRPVTVWLKNPVSPVDSVAYYTGTVAYSSPNNYIDIPYTALAGPLGQTDPTYPISTTATDYSVHVKGISWFKNTDISTDDNYVFIGTVTGNGPAATPTSFDISGQRQAFLISLDRAYRANSADNPAPGRTITVDKHAVVFQQSATTNKGKDNSNATVLVDKKAETIANGFGYVSHLSEATVSGTHFAGMKVLSNGLGSDLQPSEPITLGSGTAAVTFTRVSVDLTKFEDGFLGLGYGLLLIDGTGDVAVDGLYIISDSGITTNGCTVKDLDISTPSFSGETGNATVLIPSVFLSTNDWLASSFSDNVNSEIHGIPRGISGPLHMMFGDPQDAGKQKWSNFGCHSEDEPNIFHSIRNGRLLTRGGGSTYINRARIDDEVIGHGKHIIDIRTLGGFGSSWVPSESSSEVGWDWRGNSWGNESSGDSPPFQMPASFRIPFWINGKVDVSEPFSQVTSNRLSFTSGTFGNSDMPFGTNNQGTLLAEIQFDTPGAGDGIYLCASKPSGTDITFTKLDGSAPAFPTGDGDARFYGGSFFGPIIGSLAAPIDTQSFMLNIVAPTLKTGGMKLTHSADDTIGSTAYKYFAMMYNKDSIGFAVRDGGITYARSLTTKSATSGHNLTQWDQIETSLYTGVKAQITEYDLDSSTRYLSVPSTISDFITVRSGTGSVPRAQSIWNGISKHYNNVPMASLNGSDWEHLVLISPASSNSTPYYAIPLRVPHGATLDDVKVRVTPDKGGASGTDRFKVRIYRKQHNSSGTAEDLVSAGWTYASGGDDTNQTVTITCNQNNVINNKEYSYWAVLGGSVDATLQQTDSVDWLLTDYTLSDFGENLIFGY
jgi:hypothetical protein